MKTYNAINAGVPNGHINLHYSTKEWTEETEKWLRQCKQCPQMDHFIIYIKIICSQIYWQRLVLSMFLFPPSKFKFYFVSSLRIL